MDLIYMHFCLQTMVHSCFEDGVRFFGIKKTLFAKNIDIVRKFFFCNHG